MEQATIGERITALRKSRGMTQQQLADLLNVSNKTVSRWEREESAPDLSLVPMIADIFGITCDELLRGEVQTVQSEPKPSISAPVPKKLRIHTTLSCGLILLGLMAALVCYLGIGWRNGVLGFCLELAFCLAAGVCQTIGTLNAPEDIHSKKNAAANVAILALTLLSGSALIMNSSLDMEEILLLGIPTASIAFMAGLLVKWFLICPSPDEKLHSLRSSLACNMTIVLIITIIFVSLFSAGTGGAGGLIFGLILTPLEIFSALCIYRHDKKKLIHIE